MRVSKTADNPIQSGKIFSGTYESKLPPLSATLLDSTDLGSISHGMDFLIADCSGSGTLEL